MPQDEVSVDQLAEISDERIAFLAGESDTFAAALNTVADSLRARAVNMLQNLSVGDVTKVKALVSLQRELQSQLNEIGYDKKVRSFIGQYDASQSFAIQTLDALKVKPEAIAPLDRKALEALKAHDYTFLTGVGQDTLQAVANGVVQNTLMGTPRSQVIDNIASTLDTKLRGQAAAYADTALVSYDRRTSMAHWKAAGLETFLYRGPKDIKNRPFCEHIVGKIFTLAEIAALDQDVARYSKKPLLPVLYYGGGWNCRHVFTPVAHGQKEAAPPATPRPVPNPGARLGDGATHDERLAAAVIPADLVLKAYDNEGNHIGFRVSGSTKVYANTGSAGKEAKRILHTARPELRNKDPQPKPEPKPEPKPQPEPEPEPEPKPEPFVRKGRLGPEATHEERLKHALIPAHLVTKVFDDAGKHIGFRVSGVDTVYKSGGAASQTAKKILLAARPDLAGTATDQEVDPKHIQLKITPPRVSDNAGPGGEEYVPGPEIRRRLKAASLDRFALMAKTKPINKELAAAIKIKDEIGEKLLASGWTTWASNLTGHPEYRAADEKCKILVRQILKIEAEHNGTLREMLYARTPANIKTQVRKVGASLQNPFSQEQSEKINDGIYSFQRLVGAGHGVDGLTCTFKTEANKDRSFYDAVSHPDEIMMSKKDPKSDATVVHEMGHWYEDRDTYGQIKIREFLVRRTTDASGNREPIQQLSKLYPSDGYRPDEYARPDKFSFAYSGKQYRTQNYSRPDGTEVRPDSHGIYATEVMSMGLQYMHEDPLAFAEKDPDFFDTIWEILRAPRPKNDDGTPKVFARPWYGLKPIEKEMNGPSGKLEWYQWTPNKMTGNWGYHLKKETLSGYWSG